MPFSLRSGMVAPLRDYHRGQHNYMLVVHPWERNNVMRAVVTTVFLSVVPMAPNLLGRCGLGEGCAL